VPVPQGNPITTEDLAKRLAGPEAGADISRWIDRGMLVQSLLPILLGAIRMPMGEARWNPLRSMYKDVAGSGAAGGGQANPNPQGTALLDKLLKMMPGSERGTRQTPFKATPPQEQEYFPERAGSKVYKEPLHPEDARMLYGRKGDVSGNEEQFAFNDAISRFMGWKQ